MTQNTIDPFDHYRQLVALRIEQAGFKSNNFSFEKIGDEKHPAIIIEYIPTKARRIYAMSNDADALRDNWGHHFLKEVEAGLFHDPISSSQQFANTQIELMRIQDEYSRMLWKSTDERYLAKWRDKRDSTLRSYFSILDETRNYSKGYLKAITVLNAGAIVALLTFSHSIFANAKNCQQVVIMLKDSYPFLLGLAFSLLAMAIGYWSGVYYAHKFRTKKSKWFCRLFWFGGDIFGIFAFSCFFLGTYFARQNIPNLVSCFSASS